MSNIFQFPIIPRPNIEAKVRDAVVECLAIYDDQVYWDNETFELMLEQVAKRFGAPINLVRKTFFDAKALREQTLNSI